MLDRWLVVVVFAASLGSGLIAGVFFAFSTFVMRALARRPVAEGVAAMQAINVTVINPLFLGTFLGTAVACGPAIIGAWLQWDRPGAGWVLAGALCYLVGTFGLTLACNVPLNNALAGVAPTGSDAARIWSHYLSRWTMWNHVRTGAALAASGAFVVALRR